MADRGRALRVVRCVAAGLRVHDPSIAVGVFGSLARGDQPAPRDIDILLVGERYSAGREFASKLRVLRARLLAGHRGCGFRVAPGPIGRVVRKTLTASGFADVTTSFVFGPTPERRPSRTRTLVHVKGPINATELKLFARELPFHAYSILSGLSLRSGRLDRRAYLARIRLSRAELHRWLDSLARRVRRYREKGETVRCVRKMNQLCEAYEDARSRGGRRHAEARDDAPVRGVSSFCLRVESRKAEDLNRRPRFDGTPRAS
jgi:hypothetical protein